MGKKDVKKSMCHDTVIIAENIGLPLISQKAKINFTMCVKLYRLSKVEWSNTNYFGNKDMDMAYHYIFQWDVFLTIEVSKQVLSKHL